jgi:hypothetical protein
MKRLLVWRRSKHDTQVIRPQHNRQHAFPKCEMQIADGEKLRAEPDSPYVYLHVRKCIAAGLNPRCPARYLRQLSVDEQKSLTLSVAMMRVLLFRKLAPKRVAGLGELMECQNWERGRTVY